VAHSHSEYYSSHKGTHYDVDSMEES
jgi:hypothetical protein